MSAQSRGRPSSQQVFIDPLYPALTVGAVSGVTGLVGGGFGGLAFSRNPVLFATAAGLQCFGLGSTFWYVRQLTSRAFVNGNTPNRESILHSTFAGSVAGALNGAFRSRSNVVPGALMFGVLAMLGQVAYSGFQPGKEDTVTKLPLGQRLLGSRWNPLKRLSDEEYVGMLNERILRMDAEIAMIDEKITALRSTRSKNI